MAHDHLVGAQAAQHSKDRPNDCLHPQAPAADDPHAVRRAAHHLRGDPVRAGRAGGAVHVGAEGRARAARRAARARYRGGQGVDPKRIEQIKALYGFDKPAPERFWQMLGQFARFDLGKSFFQNKDVWQLIKEKLPVSISLGLWTFFISYLIAVPLGMAKAVRAGHALRLRQHAASSWWAMRFPASCWAWRCWWCSAAQLAVVSAARPDVEQLGRAQLGRAGSSIICGTSRCRSPPWWSGSFAVTTMLTKNSFLEEIRKQYVLTARAKGLGERQVLWKHVFRNALIPIVTGFPAAFIGAFFTGSLLIETLFSLDGLGLLSYESVIRRDYPVVLGTLYLFTLIGLVTKLISDLVLCLGGSRVSSSIEPRPTAAPSRSRSRSESPGRARLAALQAQPAGLLEPARLLHAGRPQPVRRSAVQRQAAGRALQRRSSTSR